MPSQDVDAVTQSEWRELGFFYDRDDETKTWNIVGSTAGVKKFCDLLRRYARDTRNDRLSEHEHYGPYMSLEVMTWTEPQLDGHAIAGRLDDLARLAELVEMKLASSCAGGEFMIGGEYAPRSEYVVRVAVKEDSFDPASADSKRQDAPES